MAVHIPELPMQTTTATIPTPANTATPAIHETMTTTAMDLNSIITEIKQQHNKELEVRRIEENEVSEQEAGQWEDLDAGEQEGIEESQSRIQDPTTMVQLGDGNQHIDWSCLQLERLLPHYDLTT